jgi:hypothetical protein
MNRIALLLAVLAATPVWADDDEPTVLERLLITPRKDTYSDADSKRHAIERSLPGADAPLPETGWDAFLDTLMNADVNHASHEQRVMIEKLNDPDPGRLPR